MKKAPQSVKDSTPESAQDAVAVIGMACRLAGGEGYRAFWEHLFAGDDLVREIPPDRWPIEGFYSPDFETPNRSVSKWGSFLEEVSGFDNRFFGVSPREAREMDPQQRLLLEEAWRCVEDSGVALEKLREGRTGVWVGMMARDYEHRLREGGEAVDSFECSGNFGNMMANRVSHFFGWRGPSVAIDTACSSSLVALHEARLALTAGSVDYAVVSGVSLILAPWRYLSFSKARMLSPDGRCKTFDESANGYVPGEGVAVLLLQREADRRKQGHFAHGLVKGSAVNHGGAAISLTAPRLAAQREVIREAFASAGLRPEAASYVEAHGTGTSLGDPIEFEALSQVFGERTKEAGYCALGSVKTNLGHLEPAAGLAGVIKVLLMMKHRMIAPSLHLQRPNPMMAVAGSPFRFVSKTEDWKPRGGRRCAGVSSFGFGGVNAHVVLEEVPVARMTPEPEQPDIFLLSAKSEQSLRRMVEQWRSFCRTKEFEGLAWREVCSTLRRRMAFEHRVALWVKKSELAGALGAATFTTGSKPRASRLVLGSFRGVSASAAREFFGADAGLGKAWEGALAETKAALPAKTRQAGRALPDVDWKKNAGACQFASGLAVARLIEAWIPNIRAASGESDGFDIALSWSGAVAPETLARGWKGRGGLLQIEASRVPIFDPLHQTVLGVWAVPGDYLPRLLRKAVLPSRDWHALSTKSAELIPHQQTFRHLMEAQAKALSTETEPVEAWVTRLGREESAETERGQVFALAAGYALRVLQRKWDLPERDLPESAAFREVLELLGRGWLRLEDAARVLRGEALPAGYWDPAVESMALAPLPFLADAVSQAGQTAEALRAGTRPAPSPEFAQGGLALFAGQFEQAEGKDSLGLDWGGLGGWLARRWAEGCDVAWEATPFGREGRATPLPVYEFDRSRYWIDSARGEEPAKAARASRSVERVQLTAQTDRLLESHRIAGRSLAPAALWIKLAGEKSGFAVNSVEGFETLAPLWLDEEREVEIEFDANAFEMRHGGKPLARGAVREELASKQPAEPAVASKGTPKRAVAAAAIYGRLRKLGYEYGPALRLIRSADVAADEVNCQIETPADGDWNAFLIDGLLQAGIVSAMELGVATEGLWVPHRIARITRFGPGGGAVQARVRKATFEVGSRWWQADITATDGEGKPAWRLEGARFSRVEWASQRTAERTGEAEMSGDLGAGTNREHGTAELRQILAGILEVAAEEIDGDTDWREYGMESIGLTEYAEAIGREMKLEVDPVVMYEHPTLNRLAEYLFAAAGGGSTGDVRTEFVPKPEAALMPAPVAPQKRAEPGETETPGRAQDVAIIGMAGRFPGAANLDEFWRNLLEGRDSISEIPASRWKWESYFGDPRQTANTTPSKWGGFLEAPERFDAAFFKISPREAELMDPQQRWVLETSWEVLEDAGLPAEELRGAAVGVFIGACHHDYQDLLAGAERAGEAHAATGNHLSIIPNRVSFFFDWMGPSVAVDTACSSSLVALDAAMKALATGDCRMALAGGVNLCCSPGPYLSFGHAGMLSSEGRCKTFDAAANGYVRGEGVGLVLLKPLAEALRDGNRIRAVIKGSAVSHGGAANSLTAPNPNAQAEVVGRAIRKAGVEVRSIGYVEAHGTGTPLGDPIEFAGLKSAFAQLDEAHEEAASAYCGLGSVKSNIGHLESAAGIAGVLKVVLAMKHGVLPAMLHFEKLNPHIDLEGTPFRIVSEKQEWSPSTDGRGAPRPRRAGVSSFGFGGANAHVVIEEAPAVVERASDRPAGPEIIVLSAQTNEQLRAGAQRLAEWLRGPGREVPLRDVAHTLQLGRSGFDWRLAVVATDAAELAGLLEGDWNSEAICQGRAAPRSNLGKLELTKEDREYCAALHRAGNFKKLAEFWVNGSRIDWKALNANRGGRTASLPTYPFAPTKFWGAPATLEIERVQPIPKELPGRLELLEKTWVGRPLSTTTGRLEGTHLLLVESKAAAEMASELARANPGGWLIVSREGHLIQGCAYSTEPFESVEAAEAYAAKCPKLAGIIHLTLGETSGARRSWDAGVLTLYQRLVSRFGQGGFSLMLVTESVQGRENSAPSLRGAALTGLVRMLQAEYRGLRARAVDLERGTDPRSAARTILEELSANDSVGEVCYRGGRRFGPALIRNSTPSSQAPEISSERAYLITGGTGGIGLHLAKHLIKRGARKLILMGRQPIPERADWDKVGSEATASPEVRRRIRAIQEIERQGTAVEYGAVPLEDGARLSEFLARMREKFGAMAGVVHCAGAVDAEIGAFVSKSAESFRKVLTPKIDGTQVLARQFENEALDFFILFSSVASVVPGLAVGYSDYAMANAFADFFAAWQQSRGKKWFRAVNWPLWNDVGMGRGVPHPKYASHGLRPLTVDEGLELFDRILGLPAGGNIFPVSLAEARSDFTEWMEAAQRVRKVDATESSPPAEGRLLEKVRRVFAQGLGLPVEALEPERPFSEFGVDSIILAEVTRRLDRVVGKPVDPSALLEYPSIGALTRYFEQGGVSEPIIPARGPERNLRPSQVEAEPHASETTARNAGGRRWSEPIAIIGIGCRFPGADSPEEFWKKLREGIDCVREVPPERWRSAEYFDATGAAGRTISKWGGFIDGIDLFDASYFGIPDDQAEQMDPIARLFLEAAARAVAHAGYAPSDLAGRRVGVFAGSRSSGYGSWIEDFRKSTITGIGQNFVAAQVSQFFDWKGPSLVVDTACSSSLASIHLACQSLRTGECAAALAGGSDILLDEKVYVMLTQAKALSADGRCHTFDEHANGYVPGEGAGAVLLKPLARAIADGDRIEAVILSSALNNDGRTMGITTPSLEGQQEVIERALTLAGVGAGSIGYVEAHGTGTMIGDPIELRALSGVFRKTTEEKGYCAIGSVKTSLGHLHSAAGIASLVKLTLALKQGEIPPTLHCDRPNPRFDFPNSPFYPNRELRPWPARAGARRGALSSFGFGGTNGHAILEAFDAAQDPVYRGGRKPLPAPIFQRRRYWPQQVQTTETRSNEVSIPAPPLFLVLEEES